LPVDLDEGNSDRAGRDKLKTLATICAAIGGLTALGVAVFALFVMSSGEPEGFVFAVFIAIVFGIPAAGFTIVMLSLSGVFLVAGSGLERTSVPTSVAVPDPSEQVPANKKWLFWLSYGLFGGAVLWSVPYGFLTFVHFVTGDLVQASGTAKTWLSVAVPLCVGGFLGTFIARNAAKESSTRDMT
jgi:hypothetical protein